MKGQLKVSTPEEYLVQVDEARKADITALDALIRKTVPKLKPYIHSGMLAYGPTRMKYDSGREIDWFKIGLASNKNYISLYVCGTNCDGYVAEQFKDELPKASIGKSCVRFKRLADLDEKALKQLLQEGSK
jgi:hypothetical protein